MSPRTVFSVLEEAAIAHGDAPALHQPNPGTGPDKHTIYTWNEFRRAAEEIACGLRRLDIGKGDVVALESETRAEFYLADLGIMANGSIAAALYTSYPPADLVRTLRTCAAKAVFVEDPKTLATLVVAATEPLHVQWILLTGKADGVMTLAELREEGRRALEHDPGLFARAHAEIRPHDPAILYLTSGATGEPKMGLVSHGAIVANLDMGPQVLPIGPHDRSLVFLPSAHIAQRVVMELLPIRCGMPVWFSEGLLKMPHELRSLRPTFLLAPPRVWERIYSSICTEIKKRGGLTRRLFYGSLGLALEAGRYKQQGKAVPGWIRAPLALADRIIFAKLRERLGGSLKLAISGAAPLGKDLAQFYEAIGMPLIEGYGLTEGGVATMNPVERPKCGSIGKPLPGVELRINDDGELLVGGPCLFTGYYRDPAATSAVLRDGWLYTGDIAEIDADGYVFITGRKKELLVSSNGKKIYPARIETLFKTEPLINQVLLVGDRLPYVAALFTVNVAAAETLRGMDSMKGRPIAEIIGSRPVQAEIKLAVSKVNKQLAPFEQIRKFRVLERDFSIDQGELTPTMKVRRTKVLENFRDTVSELYAGKDESH